MVDRAETERNSVFIVAEKLKFMLQVPVFNHRREAEACILHDVDVVVEIGINN